MKRRHNLWLASVGLSTAMLLSSFQVQAATTTVLTTIKPLQLISTAITNGVAETNVLLPTNASPHDYHLKPSDVKKLSEADLIVWVGPQLEAFLGKVLDKTDAHKLTLLAELEENTTGHHDEHEEHHDDHKHHDHDEDHHHEKEHKHEEHEEHEHHEEGHMPHHDHDHGGMDVHPWLSPEKAAVIATLIAEELSEIDSANAQRYQDNLSVFLTKLAATDNAIQQQLEPVKQDGYFVFHDAYNGFEEHYGLNHLGAFTISPERKPGAKHLTEIQHRLNEANAKCVFKEPQFKPAVINSVTKGSTVKIGELDPLGAAIEVNAEGYMEFLKSLANAFNECLSS